MKKIVKTSSAVRQISDIESRMLIAEVRGVGPVADSIRDSLALSVLKLNRENGSVTEYAAIPEIQCRAALGKPCKIRGHIKTMSRIVPVHFEGALVDTLTLEVEDSTANHIRTTTISSDQLVKSITTSFLERQVLDFHGCVVSLPIYTPAGVYRGLNYSFLLSDIAYSDDALQIIRATPEEIREAEKLVKKYAKKNGAITEYIREKLIEIIGIKGLDESPLLDRSLNAMIYQALSDGYDPARSLSHKLHTLVIGSPAVGKKLLTEAARILNPVFSEGHPGKITVPGIAGRALLKNGEWQSEPGLIPKAHRGTFVIQDFHHVEKKKEIMGILSMTMEDGKVIDSTAANKSHHALTGIHIDMNKHSDVYLSESDDSASAGFARFNDIGIPMNVLTRFDYIVDIPRDTERQMEISLAMQTGAQRTARYPTTHGISDEERKLKVLVAYLRTQYEEVTIPADVMENDIRTKQKELLDLNRDQLKKHRLLGDFQTRLSNSLNKYVFAIVRGNARSVAIKSDVDAAFGFLATKMKFLATIEPFETPKTWSHEPESKKVKERRKFILAEYADTDVTPENIQKRVQEKFGSVISLSTIRRDLNSLAEKPKHGIFHVPKRQNGKLKKPDNTLD